ncbi:malonyl-ACP O-methyltransferase BioC [Corallincola platygyrae]|uniref:Malonyl-[acyl-carrier protein] O-methyltransferase n=1 Tax=Corallincola platygyrae TaxID=1193278 RepID=A0ABW4XJI6_9GAMM
MSAYSQLKHRIANQFGKAANSYDGAARLQRLTAELLWRELLREQPPQRCKVRPLGATLDLGCGTGLQLEALATQSDSVCAMDLSIDMLKFASRNIESQSVYWVRGDAEHLPFENNTFDTVFSNLMVQWCKNLDRVLAELYRVLKPGGKAVLSTLMQGSLSELSQAWKSVDNYQHVNQFISEQALRAEMANSEFSRHELIQRTLTLPYARLTGLTRELKKVGANVVTENARPTPLGKADLQRLLSAYETYRNNDGDLPATYQVGILVLERSDNGVKR